MRPQGIFPGAVLTKCDLCLQCLLEDLSSNDDTAPLQGPLATQAATYVQACFIFPPLEVASTCLSVKIN